MSQAQQAAAESEHLVSRTFPNRRVAERRDYTRPPLRVDIDPTQEALIAKDRRQSERRFSAQPLPTTGFGDLVGPQEMAS